MFGDWSNVEPVVRLLDMLAACVASFPHSTSVFDQLRLKGEGTRCFSVAFSAFSPDHEEAQENTYVDAAF